MKKNASLFIAFTCLITMACTHKIDNVPSPPSQADNAKIAGYYPASSVYSKEDFEAGTKTAYAAGDINLFTGSWHFEDALVGNLSTDKLNGVKAARIRNGYIAMNYDVTNKAVEDISFSYARYGKDAAAKLGLFRSYDKGAHWSMIGDTLLCKDTLLKQITFRSVAVEDGMVRFKIQNFTGSVRVNIDDIIIISSPYYHGGHPPLPIPLPTPSRDDNMALGNPSNATSNPTDSNNYLMVKDQYALSYNNAKGINNWVSWHLSTAWLGPVDRCDCWTPDAALPAGYFQATTLDYTRTGFDRGHMCPSADRTGSSADNAATFLMTNPIAQAPQNNQHIWEKLEDYSRTLAKSGNEMYIISGNYGMGGTGDSGYMTTIAKGRIVVPAHVWKVIVVLPIGNDDVNRINNTTRVIAVDIPNTNATGPEDWGKYRISVDELETRTGYDFLSNVPIDIQKIIEAKVDSGPTK